MSEPEVCIVVTGNVDSGKSTYTSVMTYGELDNGNGLARLKVAKHPHEKKTGRTSDTSINIIRPQDNTYTGKEIMLIDLCGHESYLKTTMSGITGYFPDYGVLVVSANSGVLKMTKEHMGILLCMKIPFHVVITRIDITPKHIYDQTISTLKAILKKYNKIPIIINHDNNKDECLNPHPEQYIKYSQMMMTNHNVIPVISMSNKTGYNVENAKAFICSLQPRNTLWDNKLKIKDNSKIFYIDDHYSPKGVGLVITGIVRGGTINVGDTLYMGPYNNKFIPIKVWNIHNNVKENVKSLGHKTRGCLAIRNLDKKIDINRNKIKRGMIATSDLKQTNNLCYKFDAEIKILHHTTTISTRFTSVIHCGTVRQTAKIILKNRDSVMRRGDKDMVSFIFISRPEYLEEDNEFFFREGTTRGIGKITKIYPVSLK